MTKDADEILKTLSVEEKIRLLNGVGSWKTFDCNGKLPSISMSDGPHGLRFQDGSENYSNINESSLATCFPTASAIASSWNRDSSKKLGSSIAIEAAEKNVSILLGCGMNIKRSPLCGRNFEYFSEDPFLSGELASSYVEGVQSKNVGACIKHFACNNQEKFRQSSSSNVDERTLREIYLSGFERCIKKSNPVSIMSSYNKINGKYASANEHLLTDILRKEWGFEGIVISDWGGDIDAAKSLKAGLDLGMPDSNGYFQKQLESAIKNGTIKEEELDEACRRIIECVLKFRATDSLSGASSDEDVQDKTALELALDSAVLLKNDGFLPLSSKKTSELCVIGSLASNMRFQGGGSSHITTRPFGSALENLRSEFSVFYEDGYVSTFCPSKKRNRLNKALYEKAIKLAKECSQKNIPILIFAGLTDSYEGEGFDRDSLSLPGEQITLIKDILEISDNVALVTFSGSPIDLTFAQKSRAILHMYLCGQGSSRACCDLLCGKANPSGKLAETWPLTSSPLLAEFEKQRDDFEINYKEGTLVGYRYYETKNLPVQYEFGYGLSYTNFGYSGLEVSPVCDEDVRISYDSLLPGEKALYKVSFDVTNTGDCDGCEIVQLYVKNPHQGNEKVEVSSVALAEFAKIRLKKGESKRVEFVLGERSFSLFNSLENRFCLIEGLYTLSVGASVKNICLEQSVSVEGESFSSWLTTESAFDGKKRVFAKTVVHKKGEFNCQDSLFVMSKGSFFVRNLVALLEFLLVLVSDSKSREDPANKITIYGLEENPIESLISTGGEIFSEKLMNFIIRKANK